MIKRLLRDIDKSLDNDCFFSALALALTLPDVCGKAKYPNEESTKKRYIDWYNEYVGVYEQCPGGEGKTPYLSGEVVYSLRCSLLHEGNPNIAKSSIKEECCKIDQFTLIVERKKKFNIYSDHAEVSEQFSGGEPVGETVRNYEVNVRRLCLILAACAKGYYEENSEQFSFFKFNIVDMDERLRLLKTE